MALRVSHPDLDQCGRYFGVFAHGAARGCLIVMCDRTRWRGTGWLAVLGHELAHYEQLRDGRGLQERGVSVRGRTIAKAIRKELGRR